jgi:hypothetical protein
MSKIHQAVVAGSSLNASLWAADAGRGQTEPRVSISHRAGVQQLRGAVQSASSKGYASAYVSCWMDLSEAKGFYAALGEVIAVSEGRVQQNVQAQASPPPARQPHAPQPPASKPLLVTTAPQQFQDVLSYVMSKLTSGEPIRLIGNQGQFFVKGIGRDGVRISAGSHRTAKQLTVQLDAISVE